MASVAALQAASGSDSLGFAQRRSLMAHFHCWGLPSDSLRGFGDYKPLMPLWGIIDQPKGHKVPNKSTLRSSKGDRGASAYGA
jgi:hypothetical protein